MGSLVGSCGWPDSSPPSGSSISIYKSSFWGITTLLTGSLSASCSGTCAGWAICAAWAVSPIRRARGISLAEVSFPSSTLLDPSSLSSPIYPASWLPYHAHPETPESSFGFQEYSSMIPPLMEASRTVLELPELLLHWIRQIALM